MLESCFINGFLTVAQSLEASGFNKIIVNLLERHVAFFDVRIDVKFNAALFGFLFGFERAEIRALIYAVNQNAGTVYDPRL